jgi:hypothetical protein
MAVIFSGEYDGHRNAVVCQTLLGFDFLAGCRAKTYTLFSYE